MGVATSFPPFTVGLAPPTGTAQLPQDRTDGRPINNDCGRGTNGRCIYDNATFGRRTVGRAIWTHKNVLGRLWMTPAAATTTPGMAGRETGFIITTNHQHCIHYCEHATPPPVCRPTLTPTPFWLCNVGTPGSVTALPLYCMGTFGDSVPLGGTVR